MIPGIISVPCMCAGRNPVCVNCEGSGERAVLACKRCKGRGTEGGAPCLDCRGQTWRAIDQPGSFDRDR